MELFLVGLCLAFVIWLYFRNNPLNHSKKFMFRRFVNWFPLGMTYAFLYLARYNLNVSKNALGSLMTKEDFGIIFGVGTLVYGLSFLIVGPLVDRIGGRRGIVIAAIGACLANILMGIATYLFLNHKLALNLTLTLAILYAINMFFQSYGGVSIIKVKAYWFHVRERGTFGAIFGTLISLGFYFAFDWGQAIAEAAQLHPKNPNALTRAFQVAFATNKGTTDATWMIFFIPALILVFWAALDWWLIRDLPSEAGHEDFDTHDGSSGEMDKEFSASDLLKRIFTSPIILTIAFIELVTGVVRNGVLQWYFIFAKESNQGSAQFFAQHWGAILCVGGIIGGFAAGHYSDKYFQSRRGPPSAIAYVAMFAIFIVMAIALKTSPILVGTCASLICMFSIAVHASMSGSAAADFGGRKATATASGITDGFVYLGSAVQSVSLGFLTTKDWSYWPVFLLPFSVIGIALTIKMWKALPAATRRYLLTVEHVDITAITETGTVSVDAETVKLTLK